jgi:hypothetical protein
MGERNDSQNGQPSPHERREEIVREDRELKREVDDALKEWDRLAESDPRSPAPAESGR